MKETEIKTDEKIEIVKQSQAEIQQKLVGRVRPKKGHILFEFNIKTKEIKKANFDSVDVDFEKAQSNNLSINKKITVNKDCLYISALNEKNVKKILKRNFKIEV